eukprot:3125310-Alexandrium_andersonii.AAC.1
MPAGAHNACHAFSLQSAPTAFKHAHADAPTVRRRTLRTPGAATASALTQHLRYCRFQACSRV